MTFSVTPEIELRDLMHAVASATSIEELCDRALTSLERGLAFQCSAVRLFDDEGVLRLVSNRGLSVEQRAAVESTSFRGDASWISDLRSSAEPTASLLRESVRAAVFIPLAVGGRSVGELVCCYSEPRVFDEREKNFAAVVAGHLALALEHRRMQAQHGLDESHLRSNDVRLRLALEAGHLGAWQWDVVRDRVVWSREVEAVHGLAPGSFPGTFEAFLADVHPDDRQRVLETVSSSMRSATGAYEVTYRIVRPDEQMRWVEARGKVLRDGGDKVVGMHGVCSDVTERKRVDDARVFLAEATAVLAASLDGRATLASLTRLAVPALADWCAVHLLGDDDVIAPAEVVHGDPAKTALVWDLERRWTRPPNRPSIIRGVVETGNAVLRPRITEDEVRAAPLDAEQRAAVLALELRSMMVVPLRAHGRVFGAMTLMSSESKREYDAFDLELAQELAVRAALALDNARVYEAAESARRNAEAAAERLQIVAEASTLMAMELDHETTLRQLADFAVRRMADYCITYAYDEEAGTIRRIGLAHHDPAKVPLVQKLEEAGPPLLTDVVGPGAVIRTGNALFVDEVDDAVMQRASRDRAYLEAIRALRPCSTIIVPLRARGRTVGAAAFNRSDTSNRYYTEDDLLLARKLASRVGLLVDNARLFKKTQDAVRARDEMAAIVSHDLRNPISTIAMACAVLELPGSEEQKARTRESIRRAVKHTERLIGDLLDVACIEGGGLELRREALDVELLVSEARLLHQPLADEKALVLTQRVAADLPEATGDHARILQVLSNLLGNAVKFTPAGGRVHLNARATAVGIELSVSDSGSGISAEQLPHIFDRFWRVDRNARQGAGLGLTIAKGLVTAHGGSLTVTSELGRGTTFTVTLPATRLERTVAAQVS